MHENIWQNAAMLAIAGISAQARAPKPTIRAVSPSWAGRVGCTFYQRVYAKPHSRGGGCSYEQVGAEPRFLSNRQIRTWFGTWRRRGAPLLRVRRRARFARRGCSDRRDLSRLDGDFAAIGIDNHCAAARIHHDGGAGFGLDVA